MYISHVHGRMQSGSRNQKWSDNGMGWGFGGQGWRLASELGAGVRSPEVERQQRGVPLTEAFRLVEGKR